MIKVLNIISDTNIGGAGRVLLNYAKYRDREKFDMSVILPSGSMLTQPADPLFHKQRLQRNACRQSV